MSSWAAVTACISRPFTLGSRNSRVTCRGCRTTPETTASSYACPDEECDAVLAVSFLRVLAVRTALGDRIQFQIGDIGGVVSRASQIAHGVSRSSRSAA